MVVSKRINGPHYEGGNQCTEERTVQSLQREIIADLEMKQEYFAIISLRIA